MKPCSSCGVSKELSEFRPDGRALYGVAKKCIACTPAPTEQECNSCLIVKPIDQFALERRATNRRKTCNACRNSTKKPKTAEQRENQRAYARDYYAKNKDKYAAIVRENHLIKSYRMTTAQYDQMLALQGGQCAICGSDDPDRLAKGKQRKSFAIDHDHSCCPGSRSCGQCVRGLLCHPCNQGIGSLNDDPERLRKAIDYLEAAH